MRSLLIKKKSITISTEADWFKAAPPKGKEKQWKDSHSAKELAKYFLNGHGFLPKEVNDYLDDLGISSDGFISEPEYSTSLDKSGFGSGGCRSHDLLLWNKETVVGIEAKATENLDDYVTNKIKKKGIVTYTTNQEKRYCGLCKALLGKQINDCSNIRYQLLAATAGTLIEANIRNASKACLIILCFKNQVVSNRHLLLVENDVRSFVRCLKKNDDGSYSTHFHPEISLHIKVIVV